MNTSDPAPALSIVIPAFNERDNIAALVDEIARIEGLGDYEILCVDDHSADDTLAVLRAKALDMPRLRVLAHARRLGQSAAIRNGVKAARGSWIATLDGDGQNDPADLPVLLAVGIGLIGEDQRQFQADPYLGRIGEVGGDRLQRQHPKRMQRGFFAGLAMIAGRLRGRRLLRLRDRSQHAAEEPACARCSHGQDEQHRELDDQPGTLLRLDLSGCCRGCHLEPPLEGQNGV